MKKNHTTMLPILQLLAKANECCTGYVYNWIRVEPIFDQLKRKLPLFFSPLLYTSATLQYAFDTNRMYHAIACFYSIWTDRYFGVFSSSVRFYCPLACVLPHLLYSYIFSLSSIKNNQIIMVTNSIKIINWKLSEKIAAFFRVCFRWFACIMNRNAHTWREKKKKKNNRPNNNSNLIVWFLSFSCRFPGQNIKII